MDTAIVVNRSICSYDINTAAIRLSHQSRSLTNLGTPALAEIGVPSPFTHHNSSISIKMEDEVPQISQLRSHVKLQDILKCKVLFLEM